MVAELLCLFGQYFGDDTHLKVASRMQRLLRPVYKHILLARVTMHVDEGHNLLSESLWFVRLLCLLFWSVNQVVAKLLNRTDLRVDAKVRLHVASVKIVARHACSVITDDDAININHGNDLEDNPLSDLFCLM